MIIKVIFLKLLRIIRETYSTEIFYLWRSFLYISENQFKMMIQFIATWFSNFSNMNFQHYFTFVSKFTLIHFYDGN